MLGKCSVLERSVVLTTSIRKFSSTGTLIGPQGGSDWLNMVPDGMYQSLMWVTRRYNKPTIIITENGCDILHEGDTPFPEVLQDQYRYSSGVIWHDMIRDVSV